MASGWAVTRWHATRPDNRVDALLLRREALDLSLLDAGYGTHEGRAISFYPRSSSLGVVLPSNSPGVHSLWVPAIALKTPLVLKPGTAEPWATDVARGPGAGVPLSRRGRGS